MDSVESLHVKTLAVKSTLFGRLYMSALSTAERDLVNVQLVAGVAARTAAPTLAVVDTTYYAVDVMNAALAVMKLVVSMTPVVVGDRMEVKLCGQEGTLLPSDAEIFIIDPAPFHPPAAYTLFLPSVVKSSIYPALVKISTLNRDPSESLIRWRPTVAPFR